MRKFLLIVVLSFLYINVKSQVLNKYVYVQLIHNKKVIKVERGLHSYKKNDTINLSYNKSWFICKKNHNLDTMTIINGNRFECRMALVLSKKNFKEIDTNR